MVVFGQYDSKRKCIAGLRIGGRLVGQWKFIGQLPHVLIVRFEYEVLRDQDRQPWIVEAMLLQQLLNVPVEFREPVPFRNGITQHLAVTKCSLFRRETVQNLSRRRVIVLLKKHAGLFGRGGNLALDPLELLNGRLVHRRRCRLGTCRGLGGGFFGQAGVALRRRLDRFQHVLQIVRREKAVGQIGVCPCPATVGFIRQPLRLQKRPGVGKLCGGDAVVNK